MNALIRYTALLVWGVLLLSSCTRELRGGYEPLPEGTPITLTFDAAVPVDNSLRSSSDAKSLWLLVFDEDHRYLYRKKATVTINANPPTSSVRPDDVGVGSASGGRNKFTVTLLSSSKKRYIHFIANYDFSEKGPNHFKPDYELLKSDEGQIIPRLFTESKDGQVAEKTYWRVFDFDGLNENSFKDVDFRLLRNKARIKVTAKEGINFKFMGFCIHNAPNKGTVAPFYEKSVGTPGDGDARQMYTDVAYCFPTYPKHATMMGGYELQKKKDYLGYQEGGLVNKNPIEVYEYDNNLSQVVNTGGTKENMFVIVYGQLGEQRPGYYKIDVVKTIEADGKLLGKALPPVIRNHTYAVTIDDVRDAGYKTYDEAVSHSAANNIFASVELEDYGGVSDGVYSLVVDNTNAMMLLPGQFTVGIKFFSAEGSAEGEGNHNKDVIVSLNGKPCKGKIEPNDGYVEYANYNPDLGRLYVNVKQIPENNRKYEFKVIGAKGEQPQRTITLTLRPRFKFNAELTEHHPESSDNNPQTERVDLTFTVPGALPKTLFPYKVRVAADYLSPYVGAEVNDGMKVVSEGTRVYYEYLVKTPTNGTDRRETIHFQRSRTDKSCVVTLMSDYYVNDDVLLKEKASIDKDDRVPLLFKGLSYTTPRWVPSDYRTRLTGSPSYIADVKMVTAGYMEVTDKTGGGYQNYDYTVTAKVKEAGGSVTSRKTMKVSEWKSKLQENNAQVVLDIEEVEIEGEIYYKDWLTHPNEFKTRGAQPVPAGTSGFTFSNNLGRSGVNYDLQITSEGKFKMKVSGLKGINETMAIKVGHSGIAGTGHLESYALYLGSLLDIPTIYINEHKDGD